MSHFGFTAGEFVRAQHAIHELLAGRIHGYYDVQQRQEVQEVLRRVTIGHDSIVALLVRWPTEASNDAGDGAFVAHRLLRQSLRTAAPAQLLLDGAHC